MPERGGQFVVAQVEVPGDDVPRAYVKQLVRLTDEKLILRQFNPDKEITFPRRQVKTVHRIVASSDG